MQELSRLLAIAVFVILPIVSALYFAPSPSLLVAAHATPSPSVPPAQDKTTKIFVVKKQQIGPLEKGRKFMPAYIVTGVADSGANQEYSGLSLPYLGTTDSNYQLELDGSTHQIRHGSIIISG